MAPTPPPHSIKYVFVHSETTGQTPKPYQSQSALLIHPSQTPDPTSTSTYPCTAFFKWGTFTATFTCLYNTNTDTFSSFTLNPDSRLGGMEAVTSIIISFHRELDGEILEVLDANGNPFMFVQMELGFLGQTPLSVDIWGKRAAEGERNVAVARLSEEEREDLELERWDEGERVKYGKLLEENGGKEFVLGKGVVVEEEGEEEKGAEVEGGDEEVVEEKAVTGDWDAIVVESVGGGDVAW